jgi:hypothetical protein
MSENGFKAPMAEAETRGVVKGCVWEVVDVRKWLETRPEALKRLRNVENV